MMKFWSVLGSGSRDGLPGASGGQPSREPTRELLPAAWRGWMGRPGIRDEMIRWVPRIASSVRTLGMGAHDADWTREYPDDVTPTDAELSYLEISQRILDRMVQDRHHGVEGRGSWRQYLADTFVLRHTCGADATEAGWTDDGRLELYSTPPSTWYWWHSGPRGIERLDIMGAEGMARSIPRERLILVPLHPEEGPEGRCEMRSLFSRTNIAALAEQSWLRATRLWAGMLKAKETIASKADPANRAIIDRMLRDYEDGTRMSLLVPAGLEVEAAFPSGSPPDVVEYLQLASADIDHWAGQWLASLGAVSGSGSRALGDSMRAEDAAQWVSTLREHGRSQGRAVDEYLARALGYEGIRFPTWTVSIAESVDPEVTSRVVAANVQAGILPPAGPAVREWIAEVSGVPSDVWERWKAEAANAPPAPASAPVQSFGFPMHDDHGHELADSTSRTVVDGVGRPYTCSRDLVDVERFVAWADADDARDRAERRLAIAIDAIAQDHRRAVLQAGSDGWDEGESDRVHREYRDRYADAIAMARADLVETARAIALPEAGRQRATAPTAPTTARALERIETEISGWAADLARRSEVSTRLAADTIASRVQGEVERAIAAGARSVPPTRITPAGLAGEANATLTQAEQVGRFTAVSQGAPGLRVGWVLRSSVRDHRRCVVCSERDGTRYEFPEDLGRWGTDPASEVPDPDCLGRSERCRCGWIVGWVANG